MCIDAGAHAHRHYVHHAGAAVLAANMSSSSDNFSQKPVTDTHPCPDHLFPSSPAV